MNPVALSLATKGEEPQSISVGCGEAYSGGLHVDRATWLTKEQPREKRHRLCETLHRRRPCQGYGAQSMRKARGVEIAGALPPLSHTEDNINQLGLRGEHMHSVGTRGAVFTAPTAAPGSLGKACGGEGEAKARDRVLGGALPWKMPPSGMGGDYEGETSWMGNGLWFGRRDWLERAHQALQGRWTDEGL
ncbi:hypothetical protein NDU88_006963 [Pleurodeles waltl]|uniref:Uncharacterized protein n=1 Tax=Pleurodeles waltl TaxID=8319 RepID=A0AAV7MNU2_PLEWA|nr:hypothetical protein NDU88_006963 [Pleurodeles waltl]